MTLNHEQQAVKLSWNHFTQNLRQCANSMLLMRQDFADITLAAEHKQIKAHRFFLATGSTFFQRVLEDESPGKNDYVYLFGIKYVDIKALLHFMYTGEVVIESSRLPSFLATAAELGVKGLVEHTNETNAESPTANSSDRNTSQSGQTPAAVGNARDASNTANKDRELKTEVDTTEVVQEVAENHDEEIEEGMEVPDTQTLEDQEPITPRQETSTFQEQEPRTSQEEQEHSISQEEQEPTSQEQEPSTSPEEEPSPSQEQEPSTSQGEQEISVSHKNSTLQEQEPSKSQEEEPSTPQEGEPCTPQEGEPSISQEEPHTSESPQEQVDPHDSTLVVDGQAEKNRTDECTENSNSSPGVRRSSMNAPHKDHDYLDGRDRGEQVYGEKEVDKARIEDEANVHLHISTADRRPSTESFESELIGILAGANQTPSACNETPDPIRPASQGSAHDLDDRNMVEIPIECLDLSLKRSESALALEDEARRNESSARPQVLLERLNIMDMPSSNQSSPSKTSPRKRKDKKRKCSDVGQTKTSHSARKRRRNSSAPSAGVSAATGQAKSSSRSRTVTSGNSDEPVDQRRHLSSSRERSPLKLVKAGESMDPANITFAADVLANKADYDPIDDLLGPSPDLTNNLDLQIEITPPQSPPLTQVDESSLQTTPRTSRRKHERPKTDASKRANASPTFSKQREPEISVPLTTNSNTSSVQTLPKESQAAATEKSPLKSTSRKTQLMPSLPLLSAALERRSRSKNAPNSVERQVNAASNDNAETSADKEQSTQNGSEKSLSLKKRRRSMNDYDKSHSPAKGGSPRKMRSRKRNEKEIQSGKESNTQLRRNSMPNESRSRSRNRDTSQKNTNENKSSEAKENSLDNATTKSPKDLLRRSKENRLTKKIAVRNTKSSTQKTSPLGDKETVTTSSPRSSQETVLESIHNQNSNESQNVTNSQGSKGTASKANLRRSKETVIANNSKTSTEPVNKSITRAWKEVVRESNPRTNKEPTNQTVSHNTQTNEETNPGKNLHRRKEVFITSLSKSVKETSTNHTKNSQKRSKSKETRPSKSVIVTQSNTQANCRDKGQALNSHGITLKETRIEKVNMTPTTHLADDDYQRLRNIKRVRDIVQLMMRRNKSDGKWMCTLCQEEFKEEKVTWYHIAKTHVEKQLKIS